VDRLHVVIHGDVQGVGFRYFITRHAQARGLKGWVRNRSDGGVELVAEGERSDLDELLRTARQGPSHARVAGVDAQWSEAKGGLEPFGLSY
jgi:acylphosphatase